MSLNRLVCVLVAFCAFALLPLSLSAQITKTERFDFPVGGVLHMKNSVGRLTVESWDRPDVEITTIKSKHVYTTTERDASGLDKIRVAAEQRGNELVVTTAYPKLRSPLPFRPEFDLEYRIHAPRNAGVIVDHNSGEVQIDSFSGDVRVKIDHGSITLRLPEDNKYAIDAKVNGGSIFSDFPGHWHRVPWLLGARYDQLAEAGHKLYLRAGYGDIDILKVRKPPYALPDSTAAHVGGAAQSNLFRQEYGIRLEWGPSF